MKIAQGKRSAPLGSVANRKAAPHSGSMNLAPIRNP